MGSVVSLASVISGAFAQDVAYSARIFKSGLVVHGFIALIIGLAVGCILV